MMVMQTQCEELATDVLVVGSGAAALRAALEAEAGGARVLVVIKGEFRRSGATFHSVAEVGAFNVPEPASFALIGVGLAGIVLVRRRKPASLASA